jgi:hypothetical protein
VVRQGVTFHPSGTLRYEAWKTTEARLLATDDFTNVGLEVEPTRVPDQYNAVVRTTPRTNSLAGVLFDLIKGAPIQTSYLDFWNIGNSGVNFNGNYRWDADRRRAEGLLKIPVAVAGLLHLEIADSWRSERWNLSPVIRNEYLSQARFDYKANAIGVKVKHIPHYRVELGGGFEYRNRAAKGSIPQLFLNSLNTGRFSGQLNLRLADGEYQNRLHLEAFAARRWIIGNTQFTGGVGEFNNRIQLSKDTRTYFDWTLKGGTARGALPVEDYFVLGVETRTANLLRGHAVSDHGQYGRGPMGSDFVLLNTDIERRLATIPLFNTLNIPFISVKWEAFVDAAKTWDRTHIFKTSKLLIDTGLGLRFETPTHSFNIGYGRGLRGGQDGQNVFFGYYERRLW